MGAKARAVVIDRPGGPDVVSVREVEVPMPGPGEVRVAVRAAAVNPTDVVLREATAEVLHQARGGVDVPPPWIPGMDAAGVVEAVGAGVERLRLGDEVMCVVSSLRPAGGAQSELVVVPEASVVGMPDGASFAQAATLPMNGLTAALGLDRLDLSPGQALAVTGGAGLLASYVIALAKSRGLFVLADAAPPDEALVRSFGADVVVARGRFSEGVREAVPDGVDAVFDTALLYREAVPALRPGGRLAVVRGLQGLDELEAVEAVEVVVLEALERTDWLEELRRLASAGRVQLRVAAALPPERAADGHRLMAAGGLRGRAVVLF